MPATDAPLVSFGGCGMLFGFHAGAAEFLVERFESEDVTALGRSAGCLAAMGLAIGSPRLVLEPFCVEARRAWEQDAGRGFLRASAQWKRTAVELLSPHRERLAAADVRGRLLVSVAVLSCGGLRPVTLRSPFGSLEDVVTAACGSCCLWPFFRCPFLRVPGCRGLVMDGSFAAPAAEAQARRKVLVSVWASGEAAIRPPVDFCARDFLVPPDAARWQELMRLGHAAALAGAPLCVQAGLRPRSDGCSLRPLKEKVEKEGGGGRARRRRQAQLRAGR